MIKHFATKKQIEDLAKCFPSWEAVIFRWPLANNEYLLEVWKVEKPSWISKMLETAKR